MVAITFFLVCFGLEIPFENYTNIKCNGMYWYGIFGRFGINNLSLHFENKIYNLKI